MKAEIGVSRFGLLAWFRRSFIAPAKAHWKAGPKAHRSALQKARSSAHLIAQIGASRIAHKTAPGKALRIASFIAGGKARPKAALIVQLGPPFKASFKPQLIPWFIPCSRASLRAAAGAVTGSPPPWENCGYGLGPYHIWYPAEPCCWLPSCVPGYAPSLRRGQNSAGRLQSECSEALHSVSSLPHSDSVCCPKTRWLRFRQRAVPTVDR
jgi:hypothetical protein